MPAVPVIDLSALPNIPDKLVQDVASACATWGFFQVVNHGVDRQLCAEFQQQMRAFFALPRSHKEPLRRSASNAMGWYDDELTKQRRDWKEGLDLSSRDWSLPDSDVRAANLDGFNRFPPAEVLPRFRPVVTAYFDALTDLADQIAGVMALGLGMPRGFFSELLRRRHTSYLRMNWFPPCAEHSDPPPLGISPHRDAGFLTVLAQDMDCHSLQVRNGDEWYSVSPVPDSFTINTGDMAQIWSNNRYHAPEHRVLTHPTKDRFSAPMFYNPPFDVMVAPLPTLGAPEYNACSWGYFRAQRFAGDFADYGSEIQTSDFAAGSSSWHIDNQQHFLKCTDFSKPFSVEGNRHLLTPP